MKKTISKLLLSAVLFSFVFSVFLMPSRVSAESSSKAVYTESQRIALIEKLTALLTELLRQLAEIKASEGNSTTPFPNDSSLKTYRDERYGFVVNYKGSNPVTTDSGQYFSSVSFYDHKYTILISSNPDQINPFLKGELRGGEIPGSRKKTIINERGLTGIRWDYRIAREASIGSENRTDWVVTRSCNIDTVYVIDNKELFDSFYLFDDAGNKSNSSSFRVCSFGNKENNPNYLPQIDRVRAKAAEDFEITAGQGAVGIEGKNLVYSGKDTEVYVGGKKATVTQYDASIVYFIPPTDLFEGRYDLYVKTSAGISNIVTVTYHNKYNQSSYTPKIENVRGMAADDFYVYSGEKTSIEGKNLIYAGKDANVYINGVEGTITQYDDEVMYFTAPVMLSGRYELYVKTSYGKSNVVKVNYINNVKGTSSLRVISPNGGENFSSLGTLDVKWDANNVSGKVNVMLTSGASCYSIIAQASDERVSINLKDAASCFNSQDKFKVHISKWDPVTGFDFNVEDFSDSYFKVIKEVDFRAPSIKVISPNGGEMLKRGELQPITFTSTTYDEVTVYLEKYYSIYSTTPATSQFVTKTSHKGVNTFYYPLPSNSEISSGQFTAYKVKICFDAACSNSDSSDNFFKVLE